jgi:hypothetical protein
MKRETCSISDTVDDMQAFTQLTDDIILSILYPPTRGIASRQSETDGLTTARSILNDILERKLYKFVSQTQVKVCISNYIKSLWKVSLPKFLNEQLTILV